MRAEYLDDRDGFQTGTSQKLKEGTVTVGFAPTKTFELRLEGRYDKSDQPAFLKALAETSQTFDDNQTEIAVQGLYKF